MRIKNKITINFVVFVASLLLFVFLLIYLLADNYIANRFFEDLEGRARIAEKVYFEKDELSTSIYEKYRKKHFQVLANEQEYIFPLDELKIKSKEIQLPTTLLSQIKSEDTIRIKIKDIYYSGFIYQDEGKSFIVLVSATNQVGKKELYNLRNLLGLVFFLSCGVVFLLGRYFAKKILVPLVKIIEDVNTIRATNLHKRLAVTASKGDLNQLSLTFNSMLDRLETSFEIQSNFINNASHELKNPLTAILGKTEIVLLRDREPEEYQQVLKEIEIEALRLDALIKNLLQFAQTEYDEKGLLIKPIRLDELLLEVKQSVDLVNPENKIEIDYSDLPENHDLLNIQGNYGLISIAINNILGNACKYSSNKKVLVKLIATDSEAKIIITDQGIGIPLVDLANIFEPFYRASNVRNVKGYGFGLPLANKILKIHGGKIEVHSEKDKGTIVKMVFPKNTNL